MIKAFRFDSYFMEHTLINHEIHIFPYYHPQARSKGSESKAELIRAQDDPETGSKMFSIMAGYVHNTPEKVNVSIDIAKVNGKGSRKVMALLTQKNLWAEEVRKHLPVVTNCQNLVLTYLDDTTEMDALLREYPTHFMVKR